MSLQPKIRRILVPPASVPSKTASPAAQLAAVTHLARHSDKKIHSGLSSSSSSSWQQQQQYPTNSSTASTPPPPTAGAAAAGGGASTPNGAAAAPAASVHQRHVAQHPAQPLIAYVLESSSSSSSSCSTSNTNNNNTVIVVQHTVTHEITFAWHWWDLAATVYGETDTKKLPAAARALGTIVALQFYDPSTLYWSRLVGTATAMAASSSTTTASTAATTTTTTTSSTSFWIAGNENDNNNHTNTNTNSAVSSTFDTTTAVRWQSLAVQTDKRVLLLNLQLGPSSSVRTLYTTLPLHEPKLPTPQPQSIHHRQVQAHLCEKSIGGVPSSNILPVSDRWLLVGCADGSMKCYDWVAGTMVKKIKGLGKGDYVVHLLSANPYNQDNTKAKRMLTVTKKGFVYLIELEFSDHTSMDIQPPIARFQVPTTDTASDLTATTTGVSGGGGMGSTTIMEHTTYLYDAHTDKFQWFVASPKEGPVLYVWNLKALDVAVQQQQHHHHASTNHNNKAVQLLKPEPTLIVHFPAVSSAATTTNHNPLMGGLGLMNNTTPSKDNDYNSNNNNNNKQEASAILTSAVSSKTVTVLSGLVHPAFGEDTVVSVTVTASGDLCLHGAVALAANTTSTVQATPCMGVHLKQLIVQTIPSLEDNAQLVDQAEFKVHAVTACPLFSSGTGMCLTVATNWGLLQLELPVYSNTAAQSRSVALASRYLHFGAGLGSLGKSTMTVHHSVVTYGSLDVLTANPAGHLEPKNPVRLYESSVAHHMPPEFHKRPFRLAPLLLQSPSGVYVCLFWPCEFRYEIVATATLVQQVGQLRATGAGTNQLVPQRRNLVVATGTGVGDFCWVSDNDVFAILHAPDWQEQAMLQVPKKSEESGNYNLIMSPNLKKIGAGAMGVANLATSVTKTATNATLSATKLATSAAVNTTMTVTKGATNAANMTVGVTTKAIRSGAKGVTKGVKKSLGIFGKRHKKGDDTEGSIVTSADDDDDDDDGAGVANVVKSAAALTLHQGLSVEALRTPNATDTAVRQRYVELKRLQSVETPSTELSGGIPMATCVSLGDVSLRGGNRKPPTVIFGGPVLCVASRSEDDKEGHAHFYSRKNDADSDKATSYQSSGPTLPYPDLVAWDDDGRVCAIVVENRIAVYLSNEPVFLLLGSVRIGSPLLPTAEISSIKFVHGVLFCCTWDSVHCVFLGDLDGGICQMDTYLLASTDVPMLPEKTIAGVSYTPLTPAPLPLPLALPTVLGYQSGSLIVSTLRGVQAIPLTSPLLRIGFLLAACQVERAAKWFDAVPNSDHEGLASFVERRGHPELALQLPGLSLETIVDVSMRYGYVDRLEDVVETYGVGGLRAIDMGRGVSPSIFGPELDVHSVVVCIGAYLLAHGRVELTRRLATECLRSFGEQGKKDAFYLATLLLQVDESDATRLIQRAVAEEGGVTTGDWIMGDFVRNYILGSASVVSERT